MARRRIDQTDLFAGTPTEVAESNAPVDMVIALSDRSDTGEVVMEVLKSRTPGGPMVPIEHHINALRVEVDGRDVELSDRSDNRTAIERAQEAQRLRREQGIQPVRVDPLEKARRKPTSLRLAITAKCWDCVNSDADPNPRARIRDCPCPTCSLYPVRPFQKARGMKSDDADDEGDELEETIEQENREDAAAAGGYET